jgi:LacI family transcriptional regulator
MVDVAREAGVGPRTVSRVVNSDPTVGPEYVAKVQVAIAAVRRIAEVNPELTAIEQTARASGLTLLAASTDFDEARERDILISMCRQRLDGIIVEPIAGNHGYLESELEAGMAVVAMDRPVSGISVDCVMSDNASGIGGDLTPERVAASLDTVLHGTEPATALVTGNLDTTIAVLRVLGREASSRLAIVGFDEVPLADLLQPALTVVAQDTATIGRTAVELLRARIADPARPLQTVIVPLDLKIRGSGEMPVSR